MACQKHWSIISNLYKQMLRVGRKELSKIWFITCRYSESKKCYKFISGIPKCNDLKFEEIPSGHLVLDLVLHYQHSTQHVHWKDEKKGKEKKRRPTRSVRRKKNMSGSLFSKIQQPHVLSSSQSTVKYSPQQLDIEQHNLTRSSRGVSLKEIVIHVHKSHLLAGCVLIFNNYVQILHLWIWQLILLKIIWLPNKSWHHRHVI